MASIDDRWNGARTGPGRRWRVRYRTPAGESRSKSFDLRRDAEEFVTGLRVALRDNAFVDPARSKVTVGEMAEKWKAAKINLKPSTRSRYIDVLDTHVLPRWERTPIARVEHEDVQAWIAELVAAGQSPGSVRKIVGVLGGVLQLAVRSKRLTANPTVDLELPAMQKAEKKYLTADQVEVLAAAAGAPAPGRPRRTTDAALAQYTLVVYLLAYCGPRWSELAALDVASVNLMRRRIRIHRAVVEVDGGLLAWGPPKNGEARTLPIPKFLVDPLRDHMAGKAPTDLVFTSPEGGVLRNRNARRAWFDRAAVLAGVQGLTPHELRHTAASLAVSTGANVKAVQRMLGHKSAVVTLDTYADLFDDDLERVADRLDDLREAARVSQMCPSGQVVSLDGVDWTVVGQ